MKLVQVGCSLLLPLTALKPRCTIATRAAFTWCLISVSTTWPVSWAILMSSSPWRRSRRSCRCCSTACTTSTETRCSFSLTSHPYTIPLDLPVACVGWCHLVPMLICITVSISQHGCNFILLLANLGWMTGWAVWELDGNGRCLLNRFFTETWKQPMCSSPETACWSWPTLDWLERSAWLKTARGTATPTGWSHCGTDLQSCCWVRIILSGQTADRQRLQSRPVHPVSPPSCPVYFP